MRPRESLFAASLVLAAAQWAEVVTGVCALAAVCRGRPRPRWARPGCIGPSGEDSDAFPTRQVCDSGGCRPGLTCWVGARRWNAVQIAARGRAGRRVGDGQKALDERRCLSLCAAFRRWPAVHLRLGPVRVALALAASCQPVILLCAAALAPTSNLTASPSTFTTSRQSRARARPSHCHALTETSPPLDDRFLAYSRPFTCCPTPVSLLPDASRTAHRDHHPLHVASSRPRCPSRPLARILVSAFVFAPRPRVFHRVCACCALLSVPFGYAPSLERAHYAIFLDSKPSATPFVPVACASKCARCLATRLHALPRALPPLIAV